MGDGEFRNNQTGTYKAILSFDATAGDGKWSATQALTLKVYPATITKTRLRVTDWFGINSTHMKIKPETNSEEYYGLMRRFARNIAEHRHNVAIISAMGHADFGVDAAGNLTVDFSEFDKWVNIFIEEGVIGRIEGGHIGWRSGGWTSPFVVEIHQVKDGKEVSSQVDPGTPEADAFYKWYFPQLVTHLRDKGWLDQISSTPRR